MGIAWKIYYDDGTTYTGDPFLAPALGVLIVVHPDPEHGRYFRFNHDYYWFENNRWEGGDLFGLYDYLMRPGCKKVIFGRIVTNERFGEVYNQAMLDMDFAPKTAHSFREQVYR